MIPIDLYDCLKKILCLNFGDVPPYDYILKSLEICFEKAVNANTPKCPPSMNIWKGQVAVPQKNVVELTGSNNYVFEWNRTLARRVRNTLIAQGNELESAVEARLSPKNPSDIASSFRSKDFKGIGQNGAARRSANGSDKNSVEN